MGSEMWYRPSAAGEWMCDACTIAGDASVVGASGPFCVWAGGCSVFPAPPSYAVATGGSDLGAGCQMDGCINVDAVWGTSKTDFKAALFGNAPAVMDRVGAAAGGRSFAAQNLDNRPRFGTLAVGGSATVATANPVAGVILSDRISAPTSVARPCDRRPSSGCERRRADCEKRRMGGLTVLLWSDELVAERCSGHTDCAAHSRCADFAGSNGRSVWAQAFLDAIGTMRRTSLLARREFNGAVEWIGASRSTLSILLFSFVAFSRRTGKLLRLFRLCRCRPKSSTHPITNVDRSLYGGKSYRLCR